MPKSQESKMKLSELRKIIREEVLNALIQIKTERIETKTPDQAK